ncbi:C2H2-type zinc binding domain-containing protein spindle-F [Rhynchophorus ferrugineus]|uniref:UBZ1-type domain-containing protein n=1 Tax=Rhynchophorus ferrugineus TaxID=354439 RepID=A0A834ILJ1_RHYFE|nr:hypothetical protein GWI33_004460 [Rhynchophorus ferrugineus]
MDELQGSQYAVQIAFYTLRDRCRDLQQRVAYLENENVHLRIECSRQEASKKSLTELDCLRAQVAELSEQKGQLQDKVSMVTKENQDLWTKLGKLTKANKSLGSQLTKMNDTILQHSNHASQHSNLIRSKTFTKHELQTKVLQKKIEENDKISFELEDISLKLSDSFSKQRQELDVLCSELSNMTLVCDGMNTEKCAYLLDEELRDDIVDEIQKFAEYLKTLKELVLQQQTVLHENIKNINSFKENMEKESIRQQKSKVEKSTSTEGLPQKTYENKSTETMMEQSSASESPLRRQHESVDCCEKMCPLCLKIFNENVDFNIFEQHVQDHFIPETDNFEML